jgi:hypothetical protein
VKSTAATVQQLCSSGTQHVIYQRMQAHSREVDGMVGSDCHCMPDARCNVRVACPLTITKDIATAQQQQQQQHQKESTHIFPLLLLLGGS